MSRIIVKNLPKGITEKKLEELFAVKGVITDLRLKFNKNGVFRQFAFIGYKTEEEANTAKEYFHNTFVNTSKIKVEICTNLSDPNKPKPWKKPHMTDIAVSDKKEEVKANEKKISKKKKQIDIPKELKEDPEFKEFLGVHQDRKSKPTWGEDVDLDHSSSESEEDDKNESETEEKPPSSPKKHLNSSIENNLSKISPQNGSSSPKQAKIYNDMFTVKLKNLPYNCKKNQIKKFFQSLKIFSLRLPPKSKGFAYVSFKTEKDLKQALNKNKGYLDGHCINIIKYVKKADAEKPNSYGKSDDKELNEELLAETGRIYVRNLCYTVTEDEVEKLFVKYGPIAEIHVPIDFSTSKSKGFAFVTFMFAEHAVKAFSELDGTIFQGRVLHLIPAKPKKEYETDVNESNFKKKKEAEMKKQSSSSHNWNILFLGMNAVADAVSEKHNIKKSELLSGDSKKSVAVRMALAETEMVEKTRKFLVDNGVQLDAFSQAAAERSKTVIVVKHLPAKVTAEEIKEMFEKHGKISRVLLPPSGMVALVEFINPTEAKIAFSKLAYRKFRYLPLYLEWAPVDGLKEPLVKEDEEMEEKEEKETVEEKPTEDVNDSDDLSGGTTVYVKNINFITTQEAFEKHFKECGPMNYATISTKTDPKTAKLLSMGFGFVQFAKKDSAIYALQNLQQSILDGHALELKFANRSITSTPAVRRKKYEVKKQTSSKILVRNVPFQASEGEIRSLFKEFGALTSVRLPKKLGKGGDHRGFAFVEYENIDDATRAFDALCHSTHLFNRRLVLEWANPDSEDVSELRKRTASRYFEAAGPRKKMKKSQLKEDIVVAAARSGNQNDDDEE